jgi:hypothetical protein
VARVKRHLPLRTLGVGSGTGPVVGFLSSVWLPASAPGL